MQRIAIASISTVKSGPGKQAGTTWTLRKINFQEMLKIFEQDGTPHEFTSGSTFDEIALQPGQIIEAECTLDDEKKYLNLKKIALLPGGPVVSNPPQKQPDAQRQGEQSTNDRIAEQVAFKGVIDLLCNKVIDMSHPWAADVCDFIHKNLTSHFDSYQSQPVRYPTKSALVEKAKELGATQETDESKQHFENAGAMFAKAGLDGITRSMVLQHFKLKENAKIDPDDLWTKVYKDMILPARKLAGEMK